MRALIVGGLGFVGSYIADALLRAGAFVQIVDLGIRGRPYQQKLLPYTSLRRIEEEALNLCWGKAWDVIFHCASPVGILGILRFHGKIVADMVSATEAVLSIKTDKLVYISSSDVYSLSGGYAEGAPLDGHVGGYPRDEYRVGKIACETMVSAAMQREKRGAVIVRPFNLVGGRQCADKGFVVSRFFTALRLAQPIEVFYDGNQERAFCDVRDFVDGLFVLLNQNANGTYNVGNPANQISILELAYLCQRIAGVDTEIRMVNPNQLYPQFQEGSPKLPAIEKMTTLGWSPKIGLEAALKAVWESDDL